MRSLWHLPFSTLSLQKKQPDPESCVFHCFPGVNRHWLLPHKAWNSQGVVSSVRWHLEFTTPLRGSSGTPFLGQHTHGGLGRSTHLTQFQILGFMVGLGEGVFLIRTNKIVHAVSSVHMLLSLSYQNMKQMSLSEKIGKSQFL